MRQDIGLPIQSGNISSRDEIFLVSFEGFVKNACEGIVRTLCRDDEEWISRYPKLEMFLDMDREELFENTLLYRPKELLVALSEEKLSNQIIEEDYESLCKTTILDNSKITSFEFALYQLLHERNVKECYFYKETSFYQNELSYIKRQYDEVLQKIHFIHGDFIACYDEVAPTTAFITNHFDLQELESKYGGMDTLDSRLFIILNSVNNLNYDESSGEFFYTDEFSSYMDSVNENTNHGISAMYNFALEIDDDDE